MRRPKERSARSEAPGLGWPCWVEGHGPSHVLRRIKISFAQAPKFSRRPHDLVNPSDAGSRLVPLLVRHPGQATLSPIPGWTIMGVSASRGPRRTAAGGNGSHDRCDPRIVEIARNQTAWFVERSRRDFERIGCSLLAFHTIYPGVVSCPRGRNSSVTGLRSYWSCKQARRSSSVILGGSRIAPLVPFYLFF